MDKTVYDTDTNEAEEDEGDLKSYSFKHPNFTHDVDRAVHNYDDHPKKRKNDYM